jgi:L-ascorbate metabolism protein UlaG (beta-lactamase superfamily)
VKVTFIGHATVEIRTAGVRLLTDPVLRMRVAHLRRIAPPPPLAEICQPDVVLISHAHLDHLDPRSLRLLASCPVVAPRGCRRLLRGAGMPDVREVEPGERIRFGRVEVTALPAAHDGRRHPLSGARQTLAYLVDGRERAFFAGDTDLFDGMQAVGPGIDVALVPIWGWGARVGRGHMDPERAARAIGMLGARVAIPVHWGTLASPGAPWRDDPDRPARAFAECAAALAPAAEVRVLRPGGSTEIATTRRGG